MTIFILDADMAKCAQYLDDVSLDKQIKEIAQVLCNVHYQECTCFNITFEMSKCICNIPLNEKPVDSYKDYNSSNFKFAKWARECVANYKYLVDLGLACCGEYNYRYGLNVEHKNFNVILWSRDNVPDLPQYIIEWDKKLGTNLYHKFCTPFPLVVPKKYWINDGYGNEGNIIESYRNYYAAKLNKKIKNCKECNGTLCWICSEIWTRRGKPDWLRGEI